MPAIEGPDGQKPLPDRVIAQLREAKETRGKSVRWDRVGIAGGVIGLIVLINRRRAGKKTSKKAGRKKR